MGYDFLVAERYNEMIPYVEKGLPVEECPMEDLSEYEKNLYISIQKQLMDERANHPGVPIHLQTMEKDWDEEEELRTGTETLL